MIPVETVGLTKRYGDLDALRDCTVRAREGEVFGLLGPNGAGKTTLIRLLLGFIRPTAGLARVGGIDVAEDSVGVRRLVSYLPGDARLPRHMRGHRVLSFFARMQPSGDERRSLEVAERLELDLTRRVAFMSTGMRQKLALSVVLGPHTPILILDEPTANLDPTVRGEVLKMVSEAKAAGRTVIFSSHVLSEIEDVCDRAVFLRRGLLVLDQRLAELRDRHLIRGHAADRIAAPDGELGERLVLRQSDDGQLAIDVSGDLVAALRWLLSHPVERVRIEPVRLKTVYEGVHRPGDSTGSLYLADDEV